MVVLSHLNILVFADDLSTTIRPISEATATETTTDATTTTILVSDYPLWSTISAIGAITSTVNQTTAPSRWSFHSLWFILYETRRLPVLGYYNLARSGGPLKISFYSFSSPLPSNFLLIILSSLPFLFPLASHPYFIYSSCTFSLPFFPTPPQTLRIHLLLTSPFLHFPYILFTFRSHPHRLASPPPFPRFSPYPGFHMLTIITHQTPPIASLPFYTTFPLTPSLTSNHNLPLTTPTCSFHFPL